MLTHQQSPVWHVGSARARFLGAGAQRFYTEGVAVTAGEAINAQAGVATMSLCNDVASEVACDRGFRSCGLLDAVAPLPAYDSGWGMTRRHREQVEHLPPEHPSTPTDALAVQPPAGHLSFWLQGAADRVDMEGRPERLRHVCAFAADLLVAR